MVICMKLDSRIYSFTFNEQTQVAKLAGKTITLPFRRNETTSNSIAIKYGYNVECLSVALVDCYLYNKSLYEAKTGSKYTTKLFAKSLAIDMSNSDKKFLHYSSISNKTSCYVTEYGKRSTERKKLVKSICKIGNGGNNDITVKECYRLLDNREKLNLDGFVVFVASVLPPLLNRVLFTVPTEILEKYS